MRLYCAIRLPSKFAMNRLPFESVVMPSNATPVELFSSVTAKVDGSMAKIPLPLVDGL